MLSISRGFSSRKSRILPIHQSCMNSMELPKTWTKSARMAQIHTVLIVMVTMVTMVTMVIVFDFDKFLKKI